MTCTQIEALIVRKVDGTIDAAGRAELNAHMAACTSCREALAAQRAVRDVLQSRAAEDAPLGFDRRVLLRLREEIDWVPVADWRRWTLALSPLPALLLALLMSHASLGESTTSSASSAVSWQAWDEATGPDAPVASIVWQPGMSEESIFVAAVTAHPSDTLATFYEKHADER